jgi:hypothetical protein
LRGAEDAPDRSDAAAGAHPQTGHGARFQEDRLARQISLGEAPLVRILAIDSLGRDPGKVKV